MTDLNEKALKPCPFCGGRAERFTITDDDEVANIGGDVITCQQCGASSQVQFGEKATLAEAWNRRAHLEVATPPDEPSGNTGELIDKMADAIRGDTVLDDTPWETLSEDRKIGWRGDAERAQAVVKEYLTARRPSEQAVTVTEAMVEAVQRIRETAMRQSVVARIPECGEFGGIAQDADWLLDALKAAMEAGG